MKKPYDSPSRSSPKDNSRACLCKDKLTYSKKCCDGNLWAQGIGRITAPPDTAPAIIPYFWGISDSQPSIDYIRTEIFNGDANQENSYSNSTLPINFNAVGKYLWVAYPSISPSKTRWYVSDLNQGVMGSPDTNLWRGIEITPMVFATFSSDYKLQWTNYPTTINSVMQLRNS